jgi:hypothetical protein
MSSSGIAFQTSEQLSPGNFIEILIPWLTTASATTALSAYGRVVRQSHEMTAVHVLRHAFHRQPALAPRSLQSRLVEDCCPDYSPASASIA